MGRSYPFDISGKAFATLPFQDEQTCNMLTNFDLIYNTMTNQVTGLNKDKPHSDPGNSKILYRGENKIWQKNLIS